MPAEYENRPLSHPQVAAIELVAEIMAKGEVDPNADTFYGRLCEVTCEVTSLTRAVIFRYDSARRRVRAAGSFGIDLAMFADDFFTVESAPLARRALETDQGDRGSDDLEKQLPSRTSSCSATTQRRLRRRCPRAGAGWARSSADRGGEGPPTGRRRARDAVDPRQDGGARVDGARRDPPARNAPSSSSSGSTSRARSTSGVVQRLFGVSLALSGDHELDEETRRRCAEEVQVALGDLRTALQRPLGRTAAATRTTLAEEVARLRHEHPRPRDRVDGGARRAAAELEPLAQSVLA